MPSFTRKAIMEAFMQLLDQRPLNKITIKDVVEVCGINRNTFYYHFEDIPALIEAIVQEKADQIAREHASVGSMEEMLNIAVQSILKNRCAPPCIFLIPAIGIFTSVISCKPAIMWWAGIWKA